MVSLYQTGNELKDNGGKNINTPCLSMRYGKSHHRFTFEGQNCSRTDKMKMVCAKRKTTCDPGTVRLADANNPVQQHAVAVFIRQMYDQRWRSPRHTMRPAILEIQRRSARLRWLCESRRGPRGAMVSHRVDGRQIHHRQRKVGLLQNGVGVLQQIG